MSWFKKFLTFITPLSYVDVRTRDVKGRYIADDPKTVQNEAYKKVLRKKTKSPKKKKIIYKAGL
jgi:hypothetical protein